MWSYRMTQLTNFLFEMTESFIYIFYNIHTLTKQPHSLQRDRNRNSFPTHLVNTNAIHRGHTEIYYESLRIRKWDVGTKSRNDWRQQIVGHLGIIITYLAYVRNVRKPTMDLITVYHESFGKIMIIFLGYH